MSVFPARARLGVLAIGVSAGLVVAGLAPTATAVPTPAPEPTAAPGRYIVTLAQNPVATYDGSLPGLAATKPEQGRKVSTTSRAARAYQTYLAKEQTRVAARVGAKPARRYAVSLNAFTASLTTGQARALQRNSDVVSVTKDTFRVATNDRNSTDYLHLSGKNGLWSQLGGKSKAGRGVVVGVLDTGIWPESKSFAGAPLGKTAPGPKDKYLPYRSGGKITMTKSDGSTFTGTCETGEQWTAKLCNTKLVGARYFGKTFLSQNPDTDETDFISPRDGGGHGSHTASTAAGNAGVAATVDNRDFGKISGVAPAAKIAAYKVLWEGKTTSGGYTSDIIAGIDAAVSDGVDVINYSIGSSSESPADDPTSLAFLSAASAGIFVSASAGNSGPGAGTLDNTGPWVTTVAASTIAPYEGTVQLGNGASYLGVTTTVTGPVGPRPLVEGAAVKTAAATVADAAICSPKTLDPAKVSGKIVVCDRGGVDRVAKSDEVNRAGGVGMVLANLTDNSLDADSHVIPTVIVNPPASQAIKTYAATPGATATLRKGNLTATTIPYPQIAGFSSRGPSAATKGDVLKPDIAAPGVAILAAVAPPSNKGRNFDFYSGTSMAAPHIAGVAALYYGVRPHWSPMKVKSAMMTTARNTKTNAGKAATDPYAQGAGEVRPRQAFNPGLVYPSGDRDWLAYLEGLGIETGTGVKAKDPSDYNTPSIAIGELLGSQTVTRRVTAVKPGLYRALISVPGFRTKVSPSILSFTSKGETKTFKVTFTRTSAPFGKPATGFLRWKGRGVTVRSPIAVTPQVVSAPQTVTGIGAYGAITYSITPGVSGPFPIKKFGLASGTAEDGQVTAGEQKEYTTTVPAGAKVAQFSVRTPNTTSDLDLAVYQVIDGQRVLVGQSATGAANETVTLTAPAAGEYIAQVAGFANAAGTTTTPFSFRAAVVTTTSAEGNFTVTPTNPVAVVGRPIQIKASWSGVDANTPYLGWIEYPDGSGTIVKIN